MNQKQPETRTIEKQTDLLQQIIDNADRDIGIGISEQTGGIEFLNFKGLCVLAKLLFDSGCAPQDSSQKVLVAIAKGKTLGLDAMQSIDCFYVVNKRATLFGEAPLATCRQNPNWDESGFDQWWEQGGKRIEGQPVAYDENTIAVCQTLRKGASQPMIRSFSMVDAKRAGLLSKAGSLHVTYPQRLLPARALGYCLKDNFGDSLKGIMIRETFDEEVDGKQPVNNANELREQLDKRKEKTSQQKTDEAFKAWEGSRAEAVAKGEIPRDDPSELDIARDLLKGIYLRASGAKLDRTEALKKASMRDGKWISADQIDAIDDVDYLNQIAANLEEMLVRAVGAKV